MAAPNTNTSDLDHANATITQLVSNLNDFKEACETPSEDPDFYERLQQLRINTIYGDLAKIREDLNSVRTRLESAAESAAASNEEDAAKRNEKQANLDRTIQAAGEREREAKKSEECLSAAIKFANDRATEAQEVKAKAKEKKAGAEEKHKAAENMMQDANAKQGEAEKHKAEAEEKNKAAEKMMQDANAKEDEAEKEISDAQHLKRAVSQREQDVSRREQDVTRREQDVSRREQALETAKQASQAEASKREQTLAKGLVRIQEATTDLVDELISRAKRRLSSPVEPSGKRAKSSEPLVLRGSQTDLVGPLESMGSQADIDPIGHADKDSVGHADIDPIDTASSSRVFKSPRPRRSASATPGSSGPNNNPTVSTSGPSGPSNQFLLLSDHPAIYGLRPGFGLCPDDIRAAEDDTQRTWAQISFGDQWTMDDSNALLEEFNKYAAKGVIGQMPRVCLDRCAECPIGEEKCLHRDMIKQGSSWNKDKDPTTEECVQCSRKFHFCIRIVYVDPSPGYYDKNATDGTRWSLTRRRQ